MFTPYRGFCSALTFFRDQDERSSYAVSGDSALVYSSLPGRDDVSAPHVSYLVIDHGYPTARSSLPLHSTD